jgi:hypothetical protein
MNQSLASLLTGGQKTVSFASGSESGGSSLKAGQLVALTVESSPSDGPTVLKVAGQTLELDLDGRLPEGTKIIGRVKGEGTEQRQVKLLDTLKEFKQIQTRELLKLIQPMDVSSSSDILNRVRDQLRHRGYFQPSKLESSSGKAPAETRSSSMSPPTSTESSFGSNRTDVIRLDRSPPESIQLRSGENVSAHVTDVNSDHRITVEVQGKRIKAHVPEARNFQTGDILQLSVLETGDEPRLEVVNQVRETPVPEQEVKNLLRSMSREPTRQSVDRVTREIHSNKNTAPEKLLRRLSVPRSRPEQFSDRVLKQAQRVIQSHPEKTSSSGVPPGQGDADPMRKLFQSLNIEVNEQNLKTARGILRDNPDLKPETFLRRLTDAVNHSKSDRFNEFQPRMLRRARAVIERVNGNRANAPGERSTMSEPSPTKSPDGAESRSRSSDRIRSLLSSMNRSTDGETVKQVQQFVRDNPQSTPAELLRHVRDNTQMAQSVDVQQAREQIERLQQFFKQVDRRETLPPKQEMDRSDVKALIKDLGMKAEESVIKVAESVLNQEESPGKRLLAKVLANRSMAQDSEGRVQSQKLKQLTSLLKQNTPVSETMFNQLSSDRSLQDLSRVWDNQSNLPRLNPSEGNLEQQLKTVVRAMGFDLEAMVGKDPEQATKTLRAALMNLLSGGETSQAAQSMAGDMARGDAQSVLGQILKHSLASRAEDGSIYLFVPFQDGDQSKMMQVRFEDQRDSDQQAVDHSWGVTLDVSLSMLGDLRIHARRREDRLGVRFEADQSNAARLIREHREQLESMLDDLGYDPQVQVERLEGSIEEWADKRLYESSDPGSGSLDLTI